MSEIRSERLEMSEGAEASHLLKAVAGPAPAGAHIATLIRAAARRAGFSYSRAKALWYGEARLVRACEMDRLRALASPERGRPDALERNVANAYADALAKIESARALLDAARADLDRPRAG